MDNASKTKIVIFGAGKWGRILAELYQKNGTDVDCFCDNNEELWGAEIEGLRVVSPTELLYKKNEIRVIVITKYMEEILEQLKEMGLEDIVDKSYKHLWEAVWDIYSKENKELIEIKDNKNNGFDKVFFLLSNGLAMGGVETWSISEYKRLKEMGKEPVLIIESDKKNEIDASGLNKEYMPSRRKMSEAEHYMYMIDMLLRELPCAVICNFGGEAAGPAFVAKRIAGESVRCIMVNHSDDSIYYETSCDANEAIDYSVVISSEMKKKMIAMGFPEGKLEELIWEIPCKEKYDRKKRTSNNKIRIGFAGRITVGAPKRTDLFPKLICMLNEHAIDYEFSIAGDGPYLDELKREVELVDDNKRVVFLGRIEHNKIEEFWHNQDIMISLSDYEGHSISQCEAMAAGSVPVITDVSGARDDVCDGVNGYVVPVGSVEEMADRINRLNEDRDLLFQMSRKAYELLRNRIDKGEMNAFWEGLLKK